MKGQTLKGARPAYSRAFGGEMANEDPDHPFTDHFLFAAEGIVHSVFTKGSGPGVLLMHELPGFTPQFWRLAHWLSGEFTVFAPDLFGRSSTPSKPSNLRNTIKLCISREVHALSRNDPGPITQWLRALSKKLHDQAGGSGVGAIGMCMTGNFALTLALDPWVTAPVASQPSLPISIPFRNVDGGLQMTGDERTAFAAQQTDVMGMRFKGDRLCKAARFETIESVIGTQRFQKHEIDDIHRNPDGPLKWPHAVLTADLVNEDQSVTRQKVDEVMAFLRARI